MNNFRLGIIEVEGLSVVGARPCPFPAKELPRHCVALALGTRRDAIATPSGVNQGWHDLASRLRRAESLLRIGGFLTFVGEMKKPTEQAEIQTLEAAEEPRDHRESTDRSGAHWGDQSDSRSGVVGGQEHHNGRSQQPQTRPFDGRNGSTPHVDPRTNKQSSSVGETTKSGKFKVHLTMEVKPLALEDPRFRALLNLLAQTGSVTSSCYPAEKAPQPRKHLKENRYETRHETTGDLRPSQHRRTGYDWDLDEVPDRVSSKPTSKPRAFICLGCSSTTVTREHSPTALACWSSRRLSPTTGSQRFE